MADDQQQENQDDQQEEQQDGTGKDDAARGGDADKPSPELLKALREERDGRRKAEAALNKREKADREAEQARAIKAGEWESVAKAKDTEIADLHARIAAMEAQIADRDLALLRERIGAKYGLHPKAVAVLDGKTEAEIEADAKEWKKAAPIPVAGNTEVGKGNGQGGRHTIEQEKAAQLATGRYSAIG